MAEKREKLWGIKIWDSEDYYFTEVDISPSVKHNRPTESQIAYNSKNPYHTHNGEPSYLSGSCSGNFSDNKSGDCYEDYNFDENHIGENVVYNTDYQLKFIKWLHNDRTKFLQLSERLVIPVGILGEITWDTEKSVDDGYTCKISFDWEQLAEEFVLEDTSKQYCANCNNMISPYMIYCPKCGNKVGE